MVDLGRDQGDANDSVQNLHTKHIFSARFQFYLPQLLLTALIIHTLYHSEHCLATISLLDAQLT